MVKKEFQRKLYYQMSSVEVIKRWTVGC
ncbi:hypothetical protein AB3S75_000561 [Citrus x aurantiifolia]